MINYLITLAFFSIASYSDVRTREVSPLLTYSLLIIGLFYHLIQSMTASSFAPLMQSVMMAVSCFAFSYALYKIGVWAGGDVKLFTALGAILPAFGQFDFFPFYALIASMLSIIPFIVIYLSYYAVTVRIIRGEVKRQFAEKISPALAAPFYLLAAYEAAYAFGVHWISSVIILYLFYRAKSLGLAAAAAFFTISLASERFSAYNFAYLLAISVAVYFSVIIFKSARKHVLRETVKTNGLKEGMVSALDVYLKNKKIIAREPSWKDFFKGKKPLINSRQAGGLTQSEISRLRKLGLKQLIVKKTIPFVPVYLLGLIIMLAIETLL